MSGIDRENLIFAGIKAGKTGDEIQLELRISLNKHCEKIGNKTEQQFETNVRRYFGHMITGIRGAEPYEDIDGIDYFITFRNGVTLPAQVKNSDQAVVDVRNSDRYQKKFQRKIIVINSAPYVPALKFQKKFRYYE